MRLPLIAGNWKMYKTGEEASAYMERFLPLIDGVGGRAVVIAPPFTAIPAVAARARGTKTKVEVASQDLHYEKEGAFTGEVSPAMVRAAGASFAIVAHSERRQYFGESDESANRKVLAALGAGLSPILCVGETLAEREAGKTFAVVERQVRAGLRGVEAKAAPSVVLAYEPVWAIGTGRTASPAQAQEVHAFIRKLLAEIWSVEDAALVRILYGGSVKPENIGALMAQEDIDGALVGGASLVPETFARIVKYE